MAEVSVLILTKDEENNIRECITSCSFANEVIVIDDDSKDRTVEFAKSVGARVIQHSMNGDWGKQQTFAIQQSKCEWIFFIDADERCTPELCIEISEVLKKNEKYGYWVRRINHFKHTMVKHGPLSPNWVCRLMPAKGSYVTGFVHPQIIHQYENRRLTKSMLHYTYESWEQYANKMNQYSTLAAKKNVELGKRTNFILDIVLRPLFAFFKMYILKLGFLDGELGYMLCKNYANYTMNKYIKMKYLK